MIIARIDANKTGQTEPNGRQVTRPRDLQRRADSLKHETILPGTAVNGGIGALTASMGSVRIELGMVSFGAHNSDSSSYQEFSIKS